MKPEANPFWVWTPEDIAADKAVDLFVTPFTDFPAIESPSHTFIHGPRGSGKSMMFRMMRPDCARLVRGKCSLAELDYLGIYIPIKKTEISQTEMVYLDKHAAGLIFNEHLLCLYFAQKIAEELGSDRLDYSGTAVDRDAIGGWFRRRVAHRVVGSGCTDDIALPTGDANVVYKAFFKEVGEYLRPHWEKVERLIRELPLHPESPSEFQGLFLSYHGFLLPFVAGLREFGIFPNRPVYLLIDDADNLSLAQTQILNSWIATRTTGNVCLKASTQMRYKTRLTYGKQRIEAPHDYNEVDVSVLYTTKRDHYLDRLQLIVRRRLQLAGLPEDPRAYFPEDPDQVREIKELGEQLLKTAESGEGRGNRARDDKNRYARPEFIRRLGGPRKSTSKYSYSGFDQLAHISSGVVRWFLEPASLMYAEQLSSHGNGTPPTSIHPHIQHDKIRAFSIEFFQDDFEKMKEDAKIQTIEAKDWQEREKDYQRLEFLINAMGKTFFAILVDETKSERRVFSIALSDRPDEGVQRVLNLGVAEGYLYRATIGTKTGHGRTARYVLSRRLAPYFSLDPTSFSGYLFVTNENLRHAMHNPKALLRDMSAIEDDIQMELPISI